MVWQKQPAVYVVPLYRAKWLLQIFDITQGIDVPDVSPLAS